MKIRILLIDDHLMVRQAWAHFLGSFSDMEVIGEAATAEAGLESAREYQPDVVLLDYNLPGMNGLEVIPKLRQFAPDSKLIGVSAHMNPSLAKQMIHAGASSYLTKNDTSEELVHAIKQVHNGEKFVSSHIKQSLANNMLFGNEDEAIKMVSKISQRELEVIKLIRKGLSSTEIAEEFHISKKTIEVHRYNILRKLKMKNTAALVEYINKNSFLFR